MLSRAWGNAPAIAGALIFGIALLTMYTISSLYHSIPWGESWKSRLQRIDHSMIYLVVAGTFTPIAIGALDGVELAGGMKDSRPLKAFLPGVKTWLSVTLQLVMGWLAIAFVPNIYDAMGLGAIVFIVLGGLCYTVGAVVFTTKKPKLWSRHFSYHELFHVLVIAGSVFHFVAVMAYAIPAIVI